MFGVTTPTMEAPRLACERTFTSVRAVEAVQAARGAGAGGAATCVVSGMTGVAAPAPVVSCDAIATSERLEGAMVTSPSAVFDEATVGAGDRDTTGSRATAGDRASARRSGTVDGVAPPSLAAVVAVDAVAIGGGKGVAVAGVAVTVSIEVAVAVAGGVAGGVATVSADSVLGITRGITDAAVDAGAARGVAVASAAFRFVDVSVLAISVPRATRITPHVTAMSTTTPNTPMATGATRNVGVAACA